MLINGAQLGLWPTCWPNMVFISPGLKLGMPALEIQRMLSHLLRKSSAFTSFRIDINCMLIKIKSLKKRSSKN